MKLATEKFPERLISVIKVYGGNIEDFAVVETAAGKYYLWKYSPMIDDWERVKYFLYHSDLMKYLSGRILDNYQSKKEMEDN